MLSIADVIAIQLNPYTLHYHVQGAGPDVLLIHGWASSLRMWERTTSRLASEGFRAWAIDLPGHGESAPLASLKGRYSISNLTDAVVAFTERMDIRQVALVGHSMGGAIALDMSQRRPDATRALALVAPAVSGRLGLAPHLLFDFEIGRWLLELAQRHHVLARLGKLSMLDAPWLSRARRDALRRDTKDLERTAPQATFGGLQAVIDFDFSNRLPEVRAPTLVIVGARDRTVPPSEGELAANKIPGAKLVKLRGVGHQPVDERPEEFDRLLLGFLKGLPHLQESLNRVQRQGKTRPQTEIHPSRQVH